MAVPPGDSSLMTLSWRERDSNPRSRPPLFLPEPVHPGAAYRRVGALPLPTWPETRIGVWPARFYHPLGRL